MKNGTNVYGIWDYSGANCYQYQNRFIFFDWTYSDLMLTLTRPRVVIHRPTLLSTSFSAGTTTANPTLSIDSSVMTLNSVTTTTPIVNINSLNSAYPIGLRV